MSNTTRLTRVRKLGRFINPDTNNAVNVHTGRVVGRSVDVMFWIKSGKRQFISDRTFYHDWKNPDLKPVSFRG